MASPPKSYAADSQDQTSYNYAATIYCVHQFVTVLIQLSALPDIFDTFFLKLSQDEIMVFHDLSLLFISIFCLDQHLLSNVSRPTWLIARRSLVPGLWYFCQWYWKTTYSLFFSSIWCWTHFPDSHLCSLSDLCRLLSCQNFTSFSVCYFP